MGSCRAADLCHVQPVSFWETIKGAASIQPQKLTLCICSLCSRLTLLIRLKFYVDGALCRLTLLICLKFCVSFALFQVGIPSSHKKDNGLFQRHLIFFKTGWMQNMPTWWMHLTSKAQRGSHLIQRKRGRMHNMLTWWMHLTYKGERGHIRFKEKGTNAQHANLVNALNIQRWARSHPIQRKGDECRTCQLGECTWCGQSDTTFMY
jgi:hypothetical protein